jgi:hypothetical protein
LHLLSQLVVTFSKSVRFPLKDQNMGMMGQTIQKRRRERRVSPKTSDQRENSRFEVMRRLPRPFPGLRRRQPRLSREATRAPGDLCRKTRGEGLFLPDRHQLGRSLCRPHRPGLRILRRPSPPLQGPLSGIRNPNSGGSDRPVRTTLSPVPDLGQPFLGVHFTIKYVPTAIPAFWRENYGGLSRFDLRELGEIQGWESSLFRSNDFGFRDLALAELLKYRKAPMSRQAGKLVKKIDPSRFTRWGKPGNRSM